MFDMICDGLEFRLYGLKRNKNNKENSQCIRIEVIHGKRSKSSNISASQMFLQANRIQIQLTSFVGLHNFICSMCCYGQWEGDMEEAKKIYKDEHTNKLKVSVYAALNIRVQKCFVDGNNSNWFIPTSY